MTWMTCEQASELLPELALGELAGDDRALVIDHLGVCAGCEALAAELANVVDGLLQFTPRVDPPAGFESAVLSRIATTGQPAPLRRRPWRPRAILGAVAASAVLLAGGAGAGAWVARHQRDNYGAVVSSLGDSELRAGALVGGDGGTWGHAVAFGGQTSLVVVTMSWGVPDGAYTVMLDRTGAASTMLGTIHLVGGHGDLGQSVSDAGTVTSVRVVDSSGMTMCTAHLTVRA